VHITLQFLSIAIALLLTAAPAFAHKLLLDCRVKDDRVRVEAFYDDDTPAQKAKVSLENEANQVVAEGRTDERGLWSCPLPKPGKYTVRAESVGHAARETLVISAPARKEKVEPIKDKSTEKEPREIGSDNPSGSFVAPSDSDSPRASRSSREDKTETPWLKIGIGFAIIAVLCAGALILCKRRHSPLSLD
jgi:hypothetical protein